MLRKLTCLFVLLEGALLAAALLLGLFCLFIPLPLFYPILPLLLSLLLDPLAFYACSFPPRTP